MPVSTRPDAPAESAAARRNYLIFSIVAVITMAVVVGVVTVLLV
jgi:hypothetical protein